jgi:hypothetical protein
MLSRAKAFVTNDEMANADSPGQSSPHERPASAFWFLPEVLPEDQLEIVERHISRQVIIQGIGTLIVEFQLLETGIRDAIAYLVNPEKRDIGLITSTPLSFRHMLEVLYALFCNRIEEESEREKLRELLVACEGCAKRRNAIVHSDWYQDSDGNNIRLKSFVRRKGQPYGQESEKVVEEGLNADTNECVRCEAELTKLMTRNFPGWLRSDQS